MQLEGACHCQAVTFKLSAAHPVPCCRCYCSICRKTAGGGGYAINIGADFETLEISGEEHIAVYQAKMDDGSISPGKRSFCSQCGSALWMWDPRWPELVHPLASAIDTELPRSPEHMHIMLKDKPSWVPVEKGESDLEYQEYPKESLAEWHEQRGLSE